MRDLQMYLNPEVAATTITNTVSLSADKFTTITKQLDVNGKVIKLTINKIADKTDYYNGDNIIYTITVDHEAGSDDATNVVVVDNLPIQIKGVTASSTSGTPNVTGDDTTGYTVTLNLATFAANDPAVILTISGTVNLA